MIWHNVCVSLLGLLQESNMVAESPSSVKVSTSGACEDLDMETEEEDDLRARGLNITIWHANINSVGTDNYFMSQYVTYNNLLD